MASAEHLNGVEAVVFDAYGTLFDIHSPTARAAASIGESADALSRLWRQKQLEYTWLRSLMGAHADFRQVTGDALDFALGSHGLASEGLAGELMDAYLTLDAYGDAREVLEALKTASLPAAILSNGSPDMLASAVGSAGLADLLAHVLSVEEVGVFKPDARVYRLAVDRLGIEAGAICFVSANGWDVAGAAHFGFQAVWLNRFGAVRERLPGIPRATIGGLSGLMPLLG